MTQSNSKTIKVSVILHDLSLRLNADKLFDVINERKLKRIVLDFSDCKTITRSFAHQYLKNKQKSVKTIYEINIDKHISDMFAIIDASRKEERFNFSKWSVMNLDLPKSRSNLT